MFYDRHDYSVIPKGTIKALNRYVNDRQETGGFLYAVLCNDLRNAVSHADNDNIEVIPQIVMYIYNELPSNCWGSEKKVKSWLFPKEEMVA